MAGHPIGVGWKTTSYVPRPYINSLISQIQDPIDKALLSTIYIFGGRKTEALMLRERDFIDNETGWLKVIMPTLKKFKHGSYCKTCNKKINGPYAKKIDHLFMAHEIRAVISELPKFFVKDTKPLPPPPTRLLSIPYSDSLVENIQAWRRMILPDVEKYNPNLVVPKTWHIFPKKRVVYGWWSEIDFSEHMSGKHVWEIVKKYERLIKDDVAEGKIYPHWFRHQRDSQLAADGMNIFELAAFRGSTVASVGPYVHLMGNQGREKIKAG